MRLPLTLNIQSGRKLSDKTKDELLAEIAKTFNKDSMRAVQFCYDTIRVTFFCPEAFKKAKEKSGLYLCGLWCKILGGGPPTTMVHLFDYPFEEGNEQIEVVFGDFGEVKRVKQQSFVSDPGIFTGTRLVSIVLNSGVTLPRSITVDGYLCRIWYRGQPLICNLCGVQGHKSVSCPNKDKCRRCGVVGHFARSCPNAWGIVPVTNADPPVEEPSVGDHAVGTSPPVVAQSLSASAVADSEDIGLSASQPLLSEPSDSTSALSQSILLNIPANNESHYNVPLHESSEGNEIHSTENNVMSCISNESNVFGNSPAPSIINNGNGDINNEFNNESETVFNDGKTNESSTGINKEMNKTSTEPCIEMVNEMNNDGGEITGRSKTNSGSFDLMDLDPNGASSKRPLDDDYRSLDDDSGLLNDEPAPVRAPRLPAKKKRAARAPPSTLSRTKSQPVIPSRIKTQPVLPGRAKHSRLPVLMNDRPPKT